MKSFYRQSLCVAALALLALSGCESGPSIRSHEHREFNQKDTVSTSPASHFGWRGESARISPATHCRHEWRRYLACADERVISHCYVTIRTGQEENGCYG